MNPPPSWSRRLPFAKLQGAGNDFVLVDGRQLSLDWPAIAQLTGARRIGVGSDGLLVVDHETHADLRMRMWNPDGSEDHCGNGLRCAALYARLRGLLAQDDFVVETLAGPRRCEIVSLDGARAQIRAGMGRADLRPAAIPMRLDGDQVIDYPLGAADETVIVTALSTGTAHTVIFGEAPDDARFARLSKAIETHPLFPARTSVLWATVVDAHRLRLRIWERAIGETLSCGTGAAAAATAAVVRGVALSPVAVESAGGTLQVEIADDLTLRLTGPATHVFDGELRLP